MKQAKVLQGLGLGLDKQAVEAVRRFTFRPATENGQPAPGELAVEVPFHLSGATWRIERAGYRIEPTPGQHFSEPVKPELKEYIAPDARACQSASGVTGLEFEIGPDGVPANVHHFDPAHDELVNAAIDAAAISAVQNWRFLP